MGARHAMILRDHSTLAVGDSVASCFVRLYFLERACEAQVMMLAAGRADLVAPADGVTDEVGHQSHPEATAMLARHLACPALLRKLDRIDPGFRD